MWTHYALITGLLGTAHAELTGAYVQWSGGGDERFLAPASDYRFPGVPAAL